MNYKKACSAISLTTAIFIVALIGNAFAGGTCSSAPAKKFGDPPYGLSAQENAKGDKLEGVFEISFTDLSCNALWEEFYCTEWDQDGCIHSVTGSGECGPYTPNAANARVAVRLTRTNTSETAALYVDLGLIPTFDDLLVQNILTEDLRPLVLDALFDGDCVCQEVDCAGYLPISCDQEIYLKTIALSRTNIYPEDQEEYWHDFTIIGEFTLAVD